MRGKLVVFEGPEGCGKSTQTAKILKYCRKNRKKVIHLREPGGNVISEKIRDIILDPKHKQMSAKTELLLYVAARAQIIEEKLDKLLKDGYLVLLDRFYLATIVYQGYARGLDRKMIETLNKFVLGKTDVDVTVIYDVTLKEAKNRMKGRKKSDRLDKENDKFHIKVRNGYLAEAKRKKYKVIKTDGKSVDEIFDETIKYLNKKGVL